MNLPDTPFVLACAAVGFVALLLLMRRKGWGRTEAVCFALSFGMIGGGAIGWVILLAVRHV